jgi:hypothetical protein
MRRFPPEFSDWLAPPARRVLSDGGALRSRFDGRHTPLALLPRALDAVAARSD